MMGRTIASCGHEVASSDDLVDVEYEDEDCIAGEGFVPVTVNAVYCRPCAEALARRIAAEREAVPVQKWQHVAYFDEGQFHWMSGIRPRDCELYAHLPKEPNT
jgi:hypothetical protein